MSFSKSASTILLLVITVVLMVQNYLLVEKVDQFGKRIRALKGEVDRLSGLTAGDRVEAFAVVGLSGSLERFDLAAIPSKKILIAFTTWCNVCKETVPFWNKLESNFRESGVVILGISPDPLDDVIEYDEQMSLQFPVFSFANDSTVMRNLKLQYFPQTILIDTGHTVIRVWTGGLNERLVQELSDLIKESESDNQLH